jgi:phospholipid N-methyltransferase
MDSALYRRPSKPRTMAVTRRREAPGLVLPSAGSVVEVDRVTECHVTPPGVAQRMVEYLGQGGDKLTLEPSAGTGNLLNALFESGHSVNELVAIERHVGLCAAIRQRFTGDQYINPLNRCFLEYAAAAKGQIEYPRIVMNPPFRQVRQHIKAALDLLGPGGHDPAIVSLVALVPITYQHDEMETLEALGPDTFSSAKVHTKIIRFTLP